MSVWYRLTQISSIICAVNIEQTVLLKRKKPRVTRDIIIKNIFIEVCNLFLEYFMYSSLFQYSDMLASSMNFGDNCYRHELVFAPD